MKFVWLEDLSGQRVPVNPDRVATLHVRRAGHVALIFTAFAGGYDELSVKGTLEAIARALEGG